MTNGNEFGGGIQAVHVWYSLMIASATICGILWRISARLKRTNDIMVKFLMEHEILIADYCERKGIEAKDLPTRLEGLLGKR